MKIENLVIEIPDWLKDICNQDRRFKKDEEKMNFVITLAKINIDKGGGPFGAAIFSIDDSRLVSCGVNLVLQNNLSILHAEIVSFMLAQRLLKSYSLSKVGRFELFSSSEPCAMCLGATLWSGVRRVVYGASSSYAKSIGFDEGPVFQESWLYLKDRGIDIVGGVLEDKAKAALDYYKNKGGIIYNG